MQGEQSVLLLVYAVTLLVAVLISARAQRTVLSTAVLFLATGIALGEGSLGVIRLQPQDDVVLVLAELALFAELFTDGLRVGWVELRGAWRLPGRALLFGLPLTMVITTALALLLTNLSVVRAEGVRLGRLRAAGAAVRHRRGRRAVPPRRAHHHPVDRRPRLHRRRRGPPLRRTQRGPRTSKP